MRMTKRVLLCVISIVLVFSALGCTVVPTAEGKPTETNPTGNDTVQYAHGTTVDSNGNFVFTYNGEKYDCEFDRLMAENDRYFRECKKGR